MNRFFAFVIAISLGLFAGSVVTYLWATDTFSGGERSVPKKALAYAGDEARMAALAGGQKGSSSDFRPGRSIGLIGAEWAQMQPPKNAARDTTGAALDTLMAYVGTREKGDNAGPVVSRFLASVGLDTGYAYCAAALSYCLDAPPDSASPEVTTTRSALAQDFDDGMAVDAKVAIRMGIVPQGWVNVHVKGKGPYGHAGFVRHWRGRCGGTVEANTSKGRYGNQRDGEGIWKRKRCYEPQSYFKLDSFTPVVYSDRGFQ
jgi:hypothetical protein